MQIDLSEILSRVGYSTEDVVKLDADEFSFGGEKISITEKSDVKLRLKNTAKNKATITGEASLKIMMRCARCLKPVAVELNLKPEAIIDPDNTSGDLDELSYVSGYSFDVDGFVLDECYVQLPMNVLCKEDCKGLCIKCGRDLNEGSCDCDTFIPDPRMAKIFDIYNASKEEV